MVHTADLADLAASNRIASLASKEIGGVKEKGLNTTSETKPVGFERTKRPMARDKESESSSPKVLKTNEVPSSSMEVDSAAQPMEQDGSTQRGSLQPWGDSTS